MCWPNFKDKNKIEWSWEITVKSAYVSEKINLTKVTISTSLA